ncbi:hypothetical protein AMAG_18556 [Allomyces macrogynus ATCC 38327]|uniref:K Homology domain-containing protein n=1 Tax=Allomyces macrogynus (strain ATCC 38327) TaxID=578462 RepID=A0A0L0SDI4_ALLM3|nr:hypothetical protein AMAG_18556 [Allomyces macrogynus ATCC 38327]|eukprot:KNE60546.1 hypothetical protein AMAG_18556 [Allomyces macrogynus ATCC 38327]
MTVPKALHRRLIGPGGSAIRELMAPLNATEETAAAATAGKKGSKAAPGVSEEIKAIVRGIFALDGDRALADAAANGGAFRVDVRFPKSGETVEVRAATAELLDSAIELLEAKVASLEGEITVVLRLPAAVLPTIIGRGGSGVRELQTAEVIKVSGPSEADVDEAVQMIREAVERGLDKKH